MEKLLGRINERPPRNAFESYELPYKDIVILCYQIYGLALEMCCKPIVYDEKATAFAAISVPPRTEALMLDTWTATPGTMNTQTVGVSVIVNGQGELQRRVRKLLDEEYVIERATERINGKDIYLLSAQLASFENGIRIMNEVRQSLSSQLPDLKIN